MASTNWTTKASSIADHAFSVRIFFYTDVNDDPIIADDDTLIKRARIAVTFDMEPDGVVERPETVQRFYRAAAAALPQDGAADGRSPATPAPITTGVAGDLQALQDIVLRMKKQIRLDVNGDVEA